MIREHAALTRQFAISVDIITVVVAFILSFYIRLGLISLVPYAEPTTFWNYGLLLIIIPVIWWALLNMNNAYTWQRFTSLRAEYWRVFRTTLFGILILTAIAFVLRIRVLPRTLIAIFAFVSFSLLILEKTILYYTIGEIRRRGRNSKKTLIIGTGKLAWDFATTIENYPEWGLKVIGFLTDKPDEVQRKSHVLGLYDDLLSVLHEHPVEEVVLALPSEDLNVAREMLTLCEREGMQVRLISDFFRTIIAKLHISEIYDMPILTFSTAPAKEWQQFMKRCVDIAVSATALVTLSPLFLIIAAGIKLTSSGPVFYQWDVVGYNKKRFRGYKFRSMVRNADDLKEELLGDNEMTGPVFKIKNDPRITPLGRFLRRFSLDELPQIWSVLKGDMSLVGPRPCLQTELPQFLSWQRRKFSVKPGLTCLWQVSGRNEITDFSEWAKLDLEYIDNWSLWLDFKILLRTVPAALLGKGAS